jgi:hypothetical protein
MNYLEKYLKYKNKYVFLKKQEKQIGGGLAIIQTLYTDIENMCLIYKSTETDQRALSDKIMQLTQGIDGFIIAIRGNGLCMLNAFTTSYLLMKQKCTYDEILADFGTSINVKNLDEGLQDTNPLARVIEEDCKVRRDRVKKRFVDDTNRILDVITRKMNYETSKENLFEALEFKNLDSKESIYPFLQLGTIISNTFNCVIVDIDVMSNLVNYVVPNIENPDSENITILRSLVNSGAIDVVFIINITTHYNSFIPHFSEGTMQDANILLFNKILESANLSFKIH